MYDAHDNPFVIGHAVERNVLFDGVPPLARRDFAPTLPRDTER